MFAVLPPASSGERLAVVKPGRNLAVAAAIALVAGALVAWAVPAMAQTTTSSTPSTETTTTTVSTTITEPPKTTTETSTKSFTQTETIKNNTTSVISGTTPTTASKSSSGVAWWVWVLIGLGAVGVAVAIFQLGRGSGSRAQAAAGPGPLRPDLSGARTGRPELPGHRGPTTRHTRGRRGHPRGHASSCTIPYTVSAAPVTPAIGAATTGQCVSIHALIGTSSSEPFSPMIARTTTIAISGRT